MTPGSSDGLSATARFSLDTWAVVSATLLLLLIVSDVLPVIPW